MVRDCCCGDLWAMSDRPVVNSSMREVTSDVHLIWRKRTASAAASVSAALHPGGGNYYVSNNNDIIAVATELHASSPAGTVLWSYDLGGLCRGLQADANGVYAGTTGKVVKLSHAGTETWKVEEAAVGTVRALWVDSSGNVFTCGNVTAADNLHKYNSSGTRQWSVSDANQLNYMVVLSSGEVLVLTSAAGKIVEYDASGSLVGDWASTMTIGRQMDLDGSDNVVVVGGTSGSDIGVELFNSSGVSQWDNAGDGRQSTDAVRFAQDGGVLFSHNDASNTWVAKYSVTGVYQSSTKIVNGQMTINEIHENSDGNLLLAHAFTSL